MPSSLFLPEKYLDTFSNPALEELESEEESWEGWEDFLRWHNLATSRETFPLESDTWKQKPYS